MNRRTFLRGATVALTALGIGAVAAAPEAPPAPAVPQAKPTPTPIHHMAPDEVVYETIPEGTYRLSVQQQALDLYNSHLISFKDYRNLVGIYTDGCGRSPAGKAEIAALAKEMMSGV
jgi:hypothetical protein